MDSQNYTGEVNLEDHPRRLTLQMRTLQSEKEVIWLTEDSNTRLLASVLGSLWYTTQGRGRRVSTNAR